MRRWHVCDLREPDGLTWFYLQCILTEAAKHTCKLVCEPQRIDEKDFSKTSLLQRGRKNKSMKENGETQGKQNNSYDPKRTVFILCIGLVLVGCIK